MPENLSSHHHPRPKWVEHPQVWRGLELARKEGAVVCSGHPALDRELPGGGWPVGSMVEVLQPVSGWHEWQLCLPSLSSSEEGPVVLVACPHDPFGASLQAQGLPLSRLLRIDAEKQQARIWACEQALKCREVTAVMAWLPQLKSAEARRLQMAASQHSKLLFVFRPMAAINESSPARIRLEVTGEETMQVRIVKRRGPPMQSPLQLSPHPQRLEALLASRRKSGKPLLSPEDRSHVLDRSTALA